MPANPYYQSWTILPFSQGYSDKRIIEFYRILMVEFRHKNVLDSHKGKM